MLAHDPQCAPAPVDPSPLDLADLADEVYELAYAAAGPVLPMSGMCLEYIAMVGLFADFIGSDPASFAEFKRYLAGRTPAAGQNGLF